MTEMQVMRRGLLRLAAGHRLQTAPSQDGHVLLSPDGFVQLNESAAMILALCDGTRTCDELAVALGAPDGDGRKCAEVYEFIRTALALGWLQNDSGESAGPQAVRTDAGSTNR